MTYETLQRADTRRNNRYVHRYHSYMRYYICCRQNSNLVTRVSSEEVDVETALNCIYTDFQMLNDGDWEPGVGCSSIQDSIGMVERIAEILNVGLTDTRKEDGYEH